MSSYFYSVFSPKIKAFAFCYPSEYNDSYIDKRSVPEEVSYADYVKGIKEIETTFTAKHRFSTPKKSTLFLYITFFLYFCGRNECFGTSVYMSQILFRGILSTPNTSGISSIYCLLIKG